jgi:hypothetical protein
MPNHQKEAHALRLPMIVYTVGETPTVLRVECVLDDAVAADPELLRSNLAQALSVPGTLRAGMVVVEVPDEALLPLLSGGMPSVAPPTVPGTVANSECRRL